MKFLKKISKVAEKIIVGGDCYNYCKLASNEIDVVFEQGLKPYDLAPLIPIIKSSGSIICDEKGLDIKLSKSPSGNIFAFKNQKTKDFIFENILQID